MPTRISTTLVSLALVTTACGGTADTRPQQATTTRAPDEVVSTLRPGIDPDEVAAPVEPDDLVTVTFVYDGDSLEVDDGGRPVEIRLIGINAPEGDECHGDRSRAALEAVTEGHVGMTSGGDDTDQFGRSLRYLSAEGIDLNALLVATGSALAIQNEHPRRRHYLELMQDAFAAGRGMWELGVCGAMTVREGDVVLDTIDFDPPGPDDERLNDERITIANTTDRAVDLGGWTLRDDSTANRYRFPPGTIVAGGAALTVASGCGTDDETTLHWCADGPVWSNGGDTAILQDDLGNVVDLVTYTG